MPLNESYLTDFAALLAVRMAPRREGDPAQVMAGGTRARDVLGWVPARPALDDIVGDAWRFHCRRHGIR